MIQTESMTNLMPQNCGQMKLEEVRGRAVGEIGCRAIAFDRVKNDIKAIQLVTRIRMIEDGGGTLAPVGTLRVTDHNDVFLVVGHDFASDVRKIRIVINVGFNVAAGVAPL